MNATEKTIRERIGMSREKFVEMGRIGGIYYERGNLEKALAIFEGMVELDPTSADAHASLGAVYTQTRRDEAALRHLNTAIELDPHRIAPYVCRAEVYMRRQKLEEAVADLKEAIDRDPEEKNAGAHRARAMVLGLAEAFERAGVLSVEEIEAARARAASERAANTRAAASEQEAERVM